MTEEIEQIKGNRGEVGIGTPGRNLKRKYKSAQGKTSLKQFGKTQETELYKEWMSNKRGVLDRDAKKKKQEVRGPTIRAIAQASKAARKGKSNG